MLAILDYKAGNQTSVQRAFAHIDAECVITADPKIALAADGVIFPGVGAAGQAMRQLAESGLDTLLAEVIRQKRPLLGICLGCQILLSRCAENNTPTLGLFPGQSLRFDEQWKEPDGTPLRIPHMGWNSVEQQRPDPLFTGIESGVAMYFVHGYYVEVPDDMVLATTHHGKQFCSAYGHPGLWGVQFHPEKSGRAGLDLLANFYRYCKETAAC